MSEIFQANARVLEQRWPALWERVCEASAALPAAELVQGQSWTLRIDHVQLSSRHDRLAEARLQADSLASAPQVHLYGTGLGDLPELLLQRPALQRLAVYVLNSGVFLLTLGAIDQRAWLQDPRVELSLAGDHAEMALPFFAIPSELVLADDYNARLRDRLISETHLDFNNRQFDAAQQEVVQRLQDNETRVRADADVAQLFDTVQGREVLVIATGPTLAQHYDALKAVAARPERPLLIAVDTAYRPLREHGIVPDLVISVDPRIGQRHLPADASAGITLVYMPMVPPATIESWQGPRYGAYSFSPLYEDLRRRLPRGHLHTSGSVLHPAVDLAVKMGARHITLFGADFAFPHDRTHAGWEDGELGPSVQIARYWVKDGHGQRVKTQLNFRSYLIELERFIARHPEVAFFNTSREGALITGTQWAAEYVA